MPPSGYSHQQSNFLKGFLESCSNALEQESYIHEETLTEALRREICDIARYLQQGTSDDSQRCILELTSAFYKRILVLNPTSLTEYRNAVRKVLDITVESIMAIHIESPQSMAPQ